MFKRPDPTPPAPAASLTDIHPPQLASGDALPAPPPYTSSKRTYDWEDDQDDEDNEEVSAAEELHMDHPGRLSRMDRDECR